MEGRFNGGFFAFPVGGLTFGGAYRWRCLFSEFYRIFFSIFIVKINHMITKPDFTPGYISELDLYFFRCRCYYNKLFTATECSHATVQMIRSIKCATKSPELVLKLLDAI